DRNFVLGRLLLNLEPLRPNPADSGADPLADLATVLPLELERRVNHDHHRDLPSILFYQRSYSVPRLSNISPWTLGLQCDNPPILHRRLRHNNILLDLPLRLVLHQSRRNQGTNPIPNRLTLSKSPCRTQVGFRLLHNQRQERLELDYDEYTVRLLPQQVEVAYDTVDSVQRPRRLHKIREIVQLGRIRARCNPVNILLELHLMHIQEMVELAHNPRRVHIDGRDEKLLHEHVQLRHRIRCRLADLLDRLQRQILGLAPDDIKAS